jgi:hypothetical protein
MIDFGQLFGGSRWQLADTPTQYLYFDKSAYGFLLLERLCEETLALIDGITDVDLRRISNEIPSSWIAAGDKPELASLLLRAFLRKRDLRALVAQQLDRLRLDTEAQASQNLPPQVEQPVGKFCPKPHNSCRACTSVDPRSTLTAEASTWVFHWRRCPGSWRVTKRSAQVVLAAVHSEKASPDISGKGGRPRCVLRPRGEASNKPLPIRESRRHSGSNHRAKSTRTDFRGAQRRVHVRWCSASAERLRSGAKSRLGRTCPECGKGKMHRLRERATSTRL